LLLSILNTSCALTKCSSAFGTPMSLNTFSTTGDCGRGWGRITSCGGFRTRHGPIATRLPVRTCPT
jgi:hypothetical protein